MKNLNTYISEALVKKHIIVNNEYVDLGLESGNLWAKCNLGANNPEEFGKYYMWGSIQNNDKQSCDWPNTPFNDGKNDYSITTYLENKKNIVDSNGILLPENDAAYVELGDKWCMPTKKDFEELLNSTTQKWCDFKGVKGVKFTSKKNDNTLFIPAGGLKQKQTSGLDGACELWSSTLSTYAGCAERLYFKYRNKWIQGMARCFGLPIRPVYKDKTL